MAIFKVTHKPSGRAAVVRACCLDCARERMVKAEGEAWSDSSSVEVELIRADERKSLVVMVSGLALAKLKARRGVRADA